MAEASRRSDLPVRKIFMMLPLRSTALLVPILLGAACGSSADPSVEEPGAVERRVEVVSFDQLEQALGQDPGEGMLINFWAQWCGPCVAELPELIEVAEEWYPKGGRVHTINYDLMTPTSNVDGIVAEVNDFLDGRSLGLRSVLIYDEADYDRINEHYDLPGEIPVTLAFDKGGNLVDRVEGKAGKERFEEMMRKALGL